MHPHDYLLGVLICLTQSVIYSISAPLGIDGVLKEKLGYVFHFSDMEEIRARRGLSIPDGLVLNREKKILLIPECKSALVEEDNEPRIIQQIKSYSSNEFTDLIRLIVPDFDHAEIVIITFPEVAKDILTLIKEHKEELKETLNTVIWTVVRLPKTDQLSVKLYYGDHMDKNLDKVMNEGVQCKPPPREFLSSPDVPDQRFASVLGRRFLVSIVAGTKTLTVQQVKDENPDLALSEFRLRRILVGLFTLVPQLGVYDRTTGNVMLKTRVDYQIIHDELVRLGRMSTKEYRRALGITIEEERIEVIEELKPTKQVTLNNFMKEHRS